MFYLKLQCTQMAKPSRPCDLKAELVQQMYKHTRLASAAPSDPRAPCVSLHLPLSHIRSSGLHDLCRCILSDVHMKHVHFNTISWCQALCCCSSWIGCNFLLLLFVSCYLDSFSLLFHLFQAKGDCMFVVCPL